MATESVKIQIEIQVLLQKSAGQELELRKFFRSPDILANLISGFAHAAGGTIVVGYDPRRKRVVGVRNRGRLESLLKAAENRLGHTTLAKIEFHQVDGRDVGVIQVSAVDRLIDAPGGLLVRQEGALRAMSMAMILERLQRSRQRLGVEDMGGMLYRMTAVILAAKQKIDQESSWFSKIQGHVLGAVIGAAVGALLTVLVQYLASPLGR